ncbi:MAG TPA: hypothetical protein VMS30_00455, partial [Phycisphaerales bacterium]|nr:hypothetical protein [Phycisphaerales bacterium]
EMFRTSQKDLRKSLDEKKSFKGLEDQFIKAMKDFKAGWKPTGNAAAPAPPAKQAKPAAKA